MNRFLKFIFPAIPQDTPASLLILVARIAFGTMFFSHGMAKMIAFDYLEATFPDPLGIGTTISLSLAIFAELFCSIGVIVGALYRLCLMPMIFTMIIAFFVIHSNDTFAVRETALMYLITFTLMFIAGPGRYSTDAMIRRAIE